MKNTIKSVVFAGLLGMALAFPAVSAHAEDDIFQILVDLPTDNDALECSFAGLTVELSAALCGLGQSE